GEDLTHRLLRKPSEDERAKPRHQAGYLGVRDPAQPRGRAVSLQAERADNLHVASASRPLGQELSAGRRHPVCDFKPDFDTARDEGHLHLHLRLEVLLVEDSDLHGVGEGGSDEVGVGQQLKDSLPLRVDGSGTSQMELHLFPSFTRKPRIPSRGCWRRSSAPLFRPYPRRSSRLWCQPDAWRRARPSNTRSLRRPVLLYRRSRKRVWKRHTSQSLSVCLLRGGVQGRMGSSPPLSSSSLHDTRANETTRGSRRWSRCASELAGVSRSACHAAPSRLPSPSPDSSSPP